MELDIEKIHLFGSFLLFKVVGAKKDPGFDFCGSSISFEDTLIKKQYYWCLNITSDPKQDLFVILSRYHEPTAVSIF